MKSKNSKKKSSDSKQKREIYEALLGVLEAQERNMEMGAKLMAALEAAAKNRKKKIKDRR